MLRIARCAAVAAACSACAIAVWAASQPSGGRCGEFPRADLESAPGTCVALVASAADGLRFPRRILEVAPGRFWIVDMGSPD